MESNCRSKEANKNSIKTRKPVAQNPNVVHKDKSKYNRKKKHKGQEDE